LFWSLAKSKIPQSDLAGVLDGFHIIAPNLGSCNDCINKDVFNKIFIPEPRIFDHRIIYTLYEKGFTFGEMVNFHTDNVWTKATSSLTGLDIKVDKNKYLVLETYGWNPIRNNIQKLNLNINVNGNKLTFVRRKKNKYFFTLPNSQKISNLDISCNTFIPKELGINQDIRALGIDIKSIKLVEEIS
jgi:hypothetical protein